MRFFNKIQKIIMTALLFSLLDTLPRAELRECLTEATYSQYTYHKGFHFYSGKGKFKDELIIEFQGETWQLKEGQILSYIEGGQSND